MKNREISEFNTGSRFKDVYLAKKEIMLHFLASKGGISETDSMEMGYRSYEAELEGHEHHTTLIWIGKQFNEEGFNVRGGLMDRTLFEGGSTITEYPDHVLSKPIIWEDAIDLLYDNIMNQKRVEKEGKSGLE